MSEWWTYRLSDFLMFSARTWHRLFEIYNADVWPGQIVALVAGAALGAVAWRAGRRAARSAGALAAAVFGLLALIWIVVGWVFHVQRYATINWAALWFGAAFVLQGLLLLAAAWQVGTGSGDRLARARPGDWPIPAAGLALLLFALVVQPLIGLALGRSWRQAELFGLAPDPTVVATLGLLLMLRPLRPLGNWSWSLWLVPLSWCVVAGATAWTLGLADALLMPVVAVVALLALPVFGRPGPDAGAAA